LGCSPDYAALNGEYSVQELWESGVANTKSAEKAARQAAKHRTHNVTLRSSMRTAIRKVNDAVAKGNKDDAQSSYRAAVPIIDSMVNKRIIHRNAAARHKSRLAASVKRVSAAR
jgi:small subunit ribosomal protein S20